MRVFHKHVPDDTVVHQRSRWSTITAAPRQTVGVGGCRAAKVTFGNTKPTKPTEWLKYWQYSPKSMQVWLQRFNCWNVAFSDAFSLEADLLHSSSPSVLNSPWTNHTPLKALPNRLKISAWFQPRIAELGSKVTPESKLQQHVSFSSMWMLFDRDHYFSGEKQFLWSARWGQRGTKYRIPLTSILLYRETQSKKQWENMEKTLITGVEPL